MKSKLVLLIIFLFGIYLFCILGMSYMAYANYATSAISTPLTLSNNIKSNFVYEPLVAAVSGGVLTSGVFFFFLKRMLDNYDKRHESNERDLKVLGASLNDLEIEISNKLHITTNELHSELNDNLTLATKAIIENLASLRDTIQELVSDLATLKAEHNQCDYDAGDIKLLKNQIENIHNLYNRLDKQLTKHNEIS